VTAPIPLTVIGGFLGAGKTSLLNHILRQAPGKSIAVLVNDFGEVNIDARLIVSVEGETISLANGCVCCTIRDDLLTEVVKLCHKEPRPEHIVIETSGVSNPVVVCETFLKPAARRFAELRNIISVLDAELTTGEPAEYRALAMDQIAVADLVVVNKTDLVASGELSALRRRIEAIAPRSRIWETSRGVVPLDLVFDESFRPGSHGELLAAPPDRRENHTGRFAVWVYRSERAWTFNEIQRAVDKLPREIYRAKGTVRLDLGTNHYGVFHLTGKRESRPSWCLWGNPERSATTAFARTSTRRSLKRRPVFEMKPAIS
jgi:G3E family GTPase